MARHLRLMQEPDIIDVGLDGRVLRPPAPSFGSQVVRIALLVAIIAGVVGLAFLALWIALLLIPIALGAAAVAWLAWRWRLWQRGG